MFAVSVCFTIFSIDVSLCQSNWIRCVFFLFILSTFNCQICLVWMYLQCGCHYCNSLDRYVPSSHLWFHVKWLSTSNLWHALPVLCVFIDFPNSIQYLIICICLYPVATESLSLSFSLSCLTHNWPLWSCSLCEELRHCDSLTWFILFASSLHNIQSNQLNSLVPFSPLLIPFH